MDSIVMGKKPNPNQLNIFEQEDQKLLGGGNHREAISANLETTTIGIYTNANVKGLFGKGVERLVKLDGGNTKVKYTQHITPTIGNHKGVTLLVEYIGGDGPNRKYKLSIKAKNYKKNIEPLNPGYQPSYGRNGGVGEFYRNN